MRKLSFVALLVLLVQSSFAKSVDVSGAKQIGYNFCKAQGQTVGIADYQLVYTATGIVNGAAVNDFYIFNTGNAGFVIVAADDNVVPVLAYSNEFPFNAAFIPNNVAAWFDNYKNEINYVIGHHVQGSQDVVKQWQDLSVAQPRTLAKTTGVVLPLMKTFWNQEPNYNYLCPFDFAASKNVLTGCVATAMAQVMKYWNWPRRGVGAHAYYDGDYGMLSADFGATVYQWDSMPNMVSNNNSAVGLLMYQAGVSVDMSYGTTASGAYVVEAWSPVTNCAQYALPTYFSYKSSLQGLLRFQYDDTAWVNIIKAELDAKRPVLYTGSGSAGGHCFVADGYITYNRFHINWGWGGLANGYFIVENLAPGSEDFNSNQSIIVGIKPDSSVVAGVKEVATATSPVVYPNPATDEVHIDMAGVAATQLTLVDAAGRTVRTMVPCVVNKIQTMSVRDLTPGVYMAQLQTATGVVTRKIVVAR